MNHNQGHHKHKDNMSHQDWESVVFKKNIQNKEAKKTKKHVSQKAETIGKFVAPINFKKEMMQARVAKKKTQKELASSMNLPLTMISDWESGKKVPTNQQIAKIERALGIKLPRCKKIKNADPNDS